MPSSAGAAAQAQLFFEFGPFTLRTQDSALLREGEVVPLRFKVFETLRVLVEAHGRIVGRNQLLERVWPGEFVEENSVTQTISLLRRVLDPCFPNQRAIETLSKKGYRLAVPVKVRAEDGMQPFDMHGDRTKAADLQRPRSLIGQVLVFSPSQVADAILAARGKSTLTATLLPVQPEAAIRPRTDQVDALVLPLLVQVRGSRLLCSFGHRPMGTLLSTL